MRSQHTLDGIVLRTYDVGDADRLCVVMTRDRGRMAMRARAVRKPGSRMGPLLLPGRRLRLDVREDAHGATVAAAQAHGDIPDLSDALALAAAQQGIELTLLLTEDGEPLPGLFDLLHQYLHVCAVDPGHARVPFQLRLFHLLGFLPAHVDDRRFTSLADEERRFVRLCSNQSDFAVLCAEALNTSALDAFVQGLVNDHARRDLKSSAVFSSLSCKG